jgi:exoribonuclease-2
VDDPETSEVDDALSCLRGPGGEPRLLVHISDAAAAVEPDGPVDREARRRAVTVYLPEAKVPMIPPDLTAARLSLEEGADRAALTMEIRLGEGGRPEAVRAFRSVVRVTRRLDYAGTAEAGGLPGAIRPLLEVAREMRRARVAAGARILEAPSAHLRVRGGVPVLELRGLGGAGDVLTGESMVAFNRLAAERLRAAGAPALWRAQDAPKGPLPPREDPLFVLKGRRLFAPVRTSAVPARHEGLGVDAYLQATSPIRRYSDLVHQRQIAAVLEGRAPPHGAEELRELGQALFLRERLVRAAEADREDYWMAVLLEGRREEDFEAVVSRPPVRGRGHAWVPALLGEFPFLWPKDLPGAPPEGAPLRLRVGRLSRHRGKVTFARGGS